MNKKRILLSFGVLLTIILIFGFDVVNADSGFDSDFGGGGSDFGGSDFGSSSSSGDLDPITVLYSLIFWVLVIGVIIIIFFHRFNKAMKVKLDHSAEISDEQLEKIFPNINKDEFLQDRYNDYLKIQEDWMNFNYDGLREKLTDELYNQYEMQLETLKAKNEKNVMSDFDFKDAFISDIKNDNGFISLTMQLRVSFKDYIVNDKNEVVRGSKMTYTIINYEITFVCDLNEKIDKCPNCGAKLKKAASQKCEYCGSVISAVSRNFVMSKKENKGQIFISKW